MYNYKMCFVNKLWDTNVRGFEFCELWRFIKWVVIFELQCRPTNEVGSIDTAECRNAVVVRQISTDTRSSCCVESRPQSGLLSCLAGEIGVRPILLILHCCFHTASSLWSEAAAADWQHVVIVIDEADTRYLWAISELLMHRLSLLRAAWNGHFRFTHICDKKGV